MDDKRREQSKDRPEVSAKSSGGKLERKAPPAGGQEDVDNKTDWEQDHDESRE
jgi:hypothetical protein